MPLFKASQSPVAIGSSNGQTRSHTEPSIKSIGDTWLELNSSNFPLYGWLWRWDGGKWLSPDFEIDYSLNNLPARFDFFIHCNPLFNYYFKAINSNFVINYPQTTSYYWHFDLLTISTTGAANTFFTDNTIGNAANVWARKNTPINVLVDVAAISTNLFYLIVQPNAGSSNLFGAIQLVYNLARLPSG